MYSDRVDAASRTSIQDRLNGNTSVNHVRRRQISGKRQREDDDKWEHDLFDGEPPQVSKRRISSSDLRLKLQKKSIQQSVQSLIGVRDLRDKLSGTVRSQSMKADLPNAKPKPKSKPKPASEVSRITKKSVVSEAPAPVSKTESGSGSKKKAQKAESVDSFLQSLGLEKYSIAFQAEEVDMTALLHMTDEDLKAMGVPMGPRKKILLALESKA